MISGLLAKSYREVRVGTLLFGLGLMLGEAVLAYLPPTFYKDFSEQWLQMPFVRNMLTAFLGTEMSGTIGPWAISSIAWAHPVILALLGAHAILFCTRLPAGEIDRGTIDILLSLPVSRTRLFLCESLMWIICGSFLIVLCVLGNFVGGSWAPPELRSGGAVRWIVGANLFALYFAIGGIAWAVSTLSDRRGRATGVLFGFLLASFLLNFLIPFHEIVKKFSVLSVLRYHRPVFILRDGAWPLDDIFTLTGIGVVFWLAGWVLFTRRDICTV